MHGGTPLNFFLSRRPPNKIVHIATEDNRIYIDRYMCWFCKSLATEAMAGKPLLPHVAIQPMPNPVSGCV